MLSGEYAVLFGEESLAFTVDRFLEASVYESPDAKFHIESDIWSETISSVNLDQLPEKWHKTPLIQALIRAQKIFKNSALHIKIRSDLDLTGGMGSSSAVILAACMASYLFRKEGANDSWLVPKLAYSIQRELQNSASGYDILSQWLGGMVRMKADRQWPGLYHKENLSKSLLHHFVHPYAGGQGAPTGLVMNATLDWLAVTERQQELLNLSSKMTQSFIKFFSSPCNENFRNLIDKICQHRKFFAASPHFPHSIASALMQVANCDETWTFKTSGAGGEDAVFLIGPSTEIQAAAQCLANKAWYPLQYHMCEHGLSSDDSSQDFL